MNLIELLLKKYSHNNLAHLYLIEPQFQDNGGFAFATLSDFFAALMPQWETHDDFFIISKPQGKNYIKSEMQQIFEFTKYPAREMKNKFLLIDHVERIPTLLINKLLKEFEEPPIPVTIFLINSSKAQLLETLKSRAQVMRLPMGANQTDIELKLEHHLDFDQFCHQYLTTPAQISDMLGWMSKHIIDTQDSLIIFNEFQSMMQTIETDLALNNPTHQIQFKLFAFYKKYFSK